ncbi:MAG: sugar ABC transporter ATP-binding protein [Spirochaetales bacterium]|nr:sugar ABC transporter ATP-binding protein [Spirochaetales bacterium]
MEENIITINNIGKEYPGVQALKDVSFDIKRNTVHCIVGENGAGKSTLIKILAGAQQRSRGEIELNGIPYNPKNTRHAMNSGMSVLFQELNVIDQLTVEENLTLGMEKLRFGFIRKTEHQDRLQEILFSMDKTIKLNHKVSDLSVAQKQVIEITKAIATDSKVIIMDEPTAAITEGEIAKLFAVIKDLRKQDVTVIYISHRLNEIFEIGDYVTVMRDGCMIETRAITEFDGCTEKIDTGTGVVERTVNEETACKALIRMMLGEVVVTRYTPKEIDKTKVALSLKNISNHKLKNISFDLYKGETLGFYGLVGSGKSEIARAIYGVDDISNGEIMLNGKPINLKSPDKAISESISMVPEERRTEGLCTMLNIRENITLMNMSSVSSRGVINKSKERELSTDYISKLQIACRDGNQKTALLSGGNQQKVVLAKCLNSNPSIFLLDEPSRGVDVGAKEEIHNIIRELAKKGVSSIVFSSELPEVMNLCDRIILLYEGEIREVLVNGQNHDFENILHIVTGGSV